MLFCLMMIPKFERVPESAKDVAKNITAELFTRPGADFMKAKKFLSNNFKVRDRYKRFSNETTIPITLGASKKSGLNQNVSSLRIKG